MSLRLRLVLWLLLALALLLVPLGILTVRQAQQTVKETLERSMLSRLGFLLSQGPVGLPELAQAVQELGGVGFVVGPQGSVRYTDSGSYQLPQGMQASLRAGQTYRQIEGNWLWVGLPDEGGGLGLGTPLQEVAALPEQLLRMYLAVGGVLGLLAFGVGAWGLGRSLQPLERLSAQLTQRSPENLEPLPLPSLLEAKPAVTAMNRLMAELAGALRRLRQQEQSAKRFAYGASHELRNPLAALKGFLEVLERRPQEPRALQGALRESRRMEGLLQSLLTLTRLEGQGRAELQPLELKPWLWERFGLETSGSGWVRADPELLALAVQNLLSNAHTHGGGVGRVELEPTPDALWLWVYNRSQTFAPELLVEGFEGFRKSPDSEGVGLGLALVAAVAQATTAQVKAENLGSVARVGLGLPLFRLG